MGEERVDEYAPTPGVIEPKDEPQKTQPRSGPLYGQFLMEELKPFIDRKVSERSRMQNSPVSAAHRLAVSPRWRLEFSIQRYSRV